MRRRFAVFSVIGASLAALAVGGVGVLSASAQNDQVTLCHATASQTNPYQEITVDQSAVFNNGVVPNGHGTHTGPIFPDTAGQPPKWGDIIPAFGNYEGLNDTTQGEAILANHCEIPGPTTTTGPTTTGPTTTTRPTTTTPGAPSGPSAPKPVRTPATGLTG